MEDMERSYMDKDILTAAVKSNALAELMNRTSKIQWKYLSLFVGVLWVFVGVLGC